MFFNIFYKIVVWLISLVGVLISVLFMTLLERKILSYVALRKGPNKVSFLGYLQPMGDAMKLFGKEMSVPWVSNIFIYLFSPLMMVMILMGGWLFIFFYNSILIYYMGVIGFLCVSSLAVYVLLGSGWSSKSKYAMSGCLRGACQKMSYEVSLIFCFFMPFSLLGSYNFSWFTSEGYFLGAAGVFSVLLMWLMICVCETNRAPFDFAEGESELVSGFKLEYGALQFALLYLGEYGSIVLLSFMTSCVFFVGLWPFNVVGGVFFIMFYIWLRGTLPRFRYDLLMEVSWMVVLPVVIFWLFYFFL